MDDPGPNFRSELTAALDIVDSQINGLDDLFTAGLSAELTAVIDKARSVRQVRRHLIHNTLDAMDAVLKDTSLLNDNGYPTPIPQVVIPANLSAELQAERAVLTAALNIFEAAESASIMKATLGAPISKT